MKYEELQHILRAAAVICEDHEFVVIGSQAVLATDSSLNDKIITRSMEADLYPMHDPAKSERLGAIGLDSPFHAQFGYYADGVDESTGVFPAGWEDRRIPISGQNAMTATGVQARGWCPEIHDLLISKFIAHRPKDIEYCNAVIARGMCDHETLRSRLGKTVTPSQNKRLVSELIGAAFEALK